MKNIQLAIIVAAALAIIGYIGCSTCIEAAKNGARLGIDSGRITTAEQMDREGMPLLMTGAAIAITCGILAAAQLVVVACIEIGKVHNSNLKKLGEQ